MASFTTPQNGEAAQAEHVAQLTEDFSGLRNIPISLSGINDAAAYSLTLKNAGAGSKNQINYAADGSTVLFQVDGNGVLASATGGAAAPLVTTTGTQTLTNKTLTAPHFTSPVIDSGGLTVTAGSITFASGAGALDFAAMANPVIVGGTASLLIRDNSQSNNNLQINNNGTIGIRNTVTISSGGLSVAGSAPSAAGTVGLSGNVASTATAGGNTLPANPAGFIIGSANGAACKIPYYNT